MPTIACPCGRNQRIVLNEKMPSKKCMFCGKVFTLPVTEEGAARVEAKPLSTRVELRPESRIVIDVEYRTGGRSFVGALAFDAGEVVFACLQEGSLPEAMAPRLALGGLLAVHEEEHRGLPFAGGGAAKLAKMQIDRTRDETEGSGLNWFALVKHCRFEPAARILEQRPGSFRLDRAGIETVAVDDPSRNAPRPVVVRHRGAGHRFVARPVTRRRLAELFAR